MAQPHPTDIPIHGEVFSGDFRLPGARLAGSRCDACAEVFFPKRSVCPRCHSSEHMSQEDLATRGRIFAVTHVAKPSALYKNPYQLALIDLDDGPRLMAQVKGDPDIAKIGAPVQLVIEPLFCAEDGRRVWGYRFEVNSDQRGSP